MAVNALDN